MAFAEADELAEKLDDGLHLLITAWRTSRTIDSSSLDPIAGSS
jgi:hypothetical protein